MSFNKNLLAIEDLQEVLDRAMENPVGVRVPCTTRGGAINLRSRFNYARKLDRDRSREIYPPSHPQHGKSVYDRLTLRIPGHMAEDANTLYIEHRIVEVYDIEEIKTDDQGRSDTTDRQT